MRPGFLTRCEAAQVVSAHWALATPAAASATPCVHKVVFEKSIPAQICQLILYISNDKGLVDGFVRELTFARRRHEHFL